MHTNITVTVIRDDIYQKVRIEDLTDEELDDLLKRATPTQLRAYCPSWSIRFGTNQSGERCTASQRDCEVRRE